jgi:hypothetical protein
MIHIFVTNEANEYIHKEQIFKDNSTKPACNVKPHNEKLSECKNRHHQYAKSIHASLMKYNYYPKFMRNLKS